MSRARLFVATIFCAASFALAGFLTGFGVETGGPGRLAQAGSGLTGGVLALVGLLIVAAIVFLIIGAKRRGKDDADVDMTDDAE